MKPLSARKRRLYVLFFIVLFLISVPLALLYAGGYRYKLGVGFVETGGIFLSVPYSDANIFLNGKGIGRSHLLNKNFFIDNLAAGIYEVEVERESDYPWRRQFVVEPELVTDADVFLVPLQINTVELSFAADAPTTTKHVSRQQYTEYLSLFANQGATTSASSLGTLMIEQGKLSLHWKQKEEGIPPSIYCRAPSSCVAQIPIGTSQDILNAAFFENGVVYATPEGIYITEADVRPTPLIVTLYGKPKTEFRVEDGHLIIKNGQRLYEVIDL